MTWIFSPVLYGGPGQLAGRDLQEAGLVLEEEAQLDSNNSANLVNAFSPPVCGFPNIGSDQIIFMDKPFYGFFRSLTFYLAGFILLMIPGREIDHVGEFIFTNKEFFLYFL